jgi:hypothetical protein
MASFVATLSSWFHFYGNLSVAVYPELVEGSLTCTFRTHMNMKIQNAFTTKKLYNEILIHEFSEIKIT